MKSLILAVLCLLFFNYLVFGQEKDTTIILAETEDKQVRFIQSINKQREAYCFFNCSTREASRYYFYPKHFFFKS